MPCKNAVLRGQLSIHYLLKFMLHQQGRSLPKILGRTISLISDEWQYFVWDTAYQSTKWLDILNIWSWPWLPRPSRLRLWRGAVMLHCDKNHHKSKAFCDHQPTITSLLWPPTKQRTFVRLSVSKMYFKGIVVIQKNRFVDNPWRRTYVFFPFCKWTTANACRNCG